MDVCLRIVVSIMKLVEEQIAGMPRTAHRSQAEQ